MKHFATLVVICLVAVTTGWGQDCFGEAKFAFWGNNPVVISFTEIQTATFAAVNQDSAVLQFVASNPSGTNLVSASIYLTDKMTAVEAQTAGYQILCQDCDYYLVASGSFANWVTNGITYPIANYSNMLIEVGDRNADSVMDVAGWPVFEHYSGSGQDLGNFDFFVQCTNWSNCVVDYVSVSDTICQGEVYLFGGQLLDSVGIYQDTLENESGCDSVIELTLCMWIPDTTLVADTTCNPTSAGVFTQIFPGLSNGCDSIVITTVELMPGGGDTTITVTKFVCDVAAVDTTVQVLTTASGCDSTVTTITTLYPGAGDTTFVELQSCHVEDVGIAVETLTSQHGCDSIVVIATTLVGVDTTYASATDCDTSQVGTQIEVLTNQSGCDSVLITEVTFEPSTTTFETSTTCYQDSVGIDSLLVNDGAGCFYLQVTEVTFEPSSITYDSTTTCNLDSVTVDSVLIPDASGCLSLLVTSVVFEPSEVTYDTLTTCFPDSLGTDSVLVDDGTGCLPLSVVTTVFEPSSVVEITNTTCLLDSVGIDSVLISDLTGCMSLEVTTTVLSGADTTSLSGTTCIADSAGVFTTLFTNQNGCDSIVIETVEFIPGDITLLFATSCNPAVVGQDTVFLTNAFGCDSLVITSTTLAAGPQLSGETTSPRCFGQSNGSIDLTVVGNGPFVFYWDPTGSGEEDQEDLPAGTYSVTVIDQQGCEDSLEVALQQPDSLTVVLNELRDIKCNGDSAFIDVLGAGGTYPYTYQWSNGISEHLQFPLAGSYSVTVTDANGCTTEVAFDITEPQPISLSIVTTLVECETGQGGGATVSVTGGDGPYTFDWSNGETGQTPSLAEGAYTVTVTDANSCTADTSVTIYCDGCRMWSGGKTLFVKINTLDVNDNFEVSVKILTIGGKEEEKFTLNVESGIGERDFDLSHLPTGIYLARAQGGDGKIDKVEKIIN